MGTTVQGNIPYPEPTDPVANGAANMRTIAEAVGPYLVNWYASDAARDAAIPAPHYGQAAVVGPGRLMVWEGVWVQPGACVQRIVLPQTANIQQSVILGGSGFTFPSSRRRYIVTLMANVFKGGASGTAFFQPSVGGQTLSAFGFGFWASPLASAIHASWVVEPGSNGGGIAAWCDNYTINVEAGSYLTVVDAGQLA